MWIILFLNFPSTHEEELEDKSISEKETVDSKKVEYKSDMNRPQWIVVFVFLTLLTIFSIKALCCDGYNLVKSHYRDWYSFWTGTVDVQLILDLQNYKVNAKLLEDTGILKTIQEKTKFSNENIELEEVEISNTRGENNPIKTKSQEVIEPEVHQCNSKEWIEEAIEKV